jgi:hypothetical protein
LRPNFCALETYATPQKHYLLRNIGLNAIIEICTKENNSAEQACGRIILVGFVIKGPKRARNF